jgi:hypothetical protein
MVKSLLPMQLRRVSPRISPSELLTNLTEDVRKGAYTLSETYADGEEKDYALWLYYSERRYSYDRRDGW